MEAKETDYFGERRALLAQVTQSYKQLLELFPKTGTDSGEIGARIRAGIAAMASSPGATDDRRDKFTKLAGDLVEAARVLQSEMSDRSRNHDQDMAFLQTRRAAEQRHAWSVWKDSMIRWVLSAAAVVVLYSVAIGISEKWTFIKVPIHDLVTDYKAKPKGGAE